MLFTIIYNKGISKEVLQGIRNKSYSLSEIHAIHDKIDDKYKNKKKGYSTALIAVIICAVFVMLLGMQNSDINMIAVITPIALLICIVVAFAYVKKNMVNKEKKQFIDALSIGYPELVEKYK